MDSVGQVFRQRMPGMTSLCSGISKVLPGKISVLVVTQHLGVGIIQRLCCSHVYCLRGRTWSPGLAPSPQLLHVAGLPYNMAACHGWASYMAAQAPTARVPVNRVEAAWPFCDPVLEVTQHHFCFLFFLIALSSHEPRFKERRNTLPPTLHEGSIKEF